MVDEASIERLSGGLRRIAPESVQVGARSISDHDIASLHADEAAHVAAAVPKRRREYASGRALVRELLGRDVTIPSAVDRKPIWPDDVCGSIAHDADAVVAAVADRRGTAPIEALGVDIEPDTPLDRATAAVVLRRDERGIDAHLAFTLKEAVYKAWSAMGGRFLQHHDVRVEVIGRPGAGPVHFVGTVVDDGEKFNGQVLYVADRWLALVVR